MSVGCVRPSDDVFENFVVKDKFKVFGQYLHRYVQKRAIVKRTLTG